MVRTCAPRHSKFKQDLVVRITDRVKDDTIRLEAPILMNLAGHKHIVNTHRAFIDSTHACFVQERLPGGTVRGLLEESDAFDELTARTILLHVARGLMHCHEHGVVHGDVRPSNVMMDGCGRAVLIDFDDASWCGADERVLGAATSRYNAAPEVINSGMRGMATDVWSLGVLAEAFAHPYLVCRPINNGDYDHVSGGNRGVTTGAPWSDAAKRQSEDFVGLILRKTRPTIHEVMQHPWLAPPEAVIVAPVIKPFEQPSPTGRETPS
jgi:serine/threonine protein kinase